MCVVISVSTEPSPCHTANHIKNHQLGEFDNEFADQDMISLGIDWYNGVNIQVRFGG